MKDSMTAIERMSAYSRGELIDRLPCVPIVGNTGARVIGEKVSRLRRDGKLLAKAQIEAYRTFGYDNIRVFTDLFTLPEAMGAAVRVPDDETAYIESPAITSAEEIASLSPVDASKSEILQTCLEAMRITLDAVGKEVPVTGALTAPFTNAALVIGVERISRLMIQNPEAVHTLCEVSLQSCLEYAKEIIGTGCSPSLSDPMASGTVISKKHFEIFAFPYLKRLIDYIHSRKKASTLHICGKTEKVWDLMADTGADCLSIDNEVSLLKAKETVGHRVRIMGNVRPSEVMLEGTQDDVKTAVRKCIREGYDSPKGVIIASGCSLPTETPFENILTMIETVREAGYPVKVQEG
jgi:uroporphyrinogen decarboxylase